ncbi:hypothetical protein VNO77_18137 [Canavalia gladiata]|uniref:Uncharacterized protein n=1 Tax=Canavalia gladiata TaxID=3824 RepID=A0AAN9LKZ0_CANGL
MRRFSMDRGEDARFGWAVKDSCRILISVIHSQERKCINLNVSKVRLEASEVSVDECARRKRTGAQKGENDKQEFEEAIDNGWSESRHLVNLCKVDPATSTFALLSLSHSWPNYANQWSFSRSPLLISLLCFILSIAVDVSSVYAAVCSVQDKAFSASSVIKNHRKCAAVTTICCLRPMPRHTVCKL